MLCKIVLQAESEPPAAEPQETRSDSSWFDEDPGPAGHSEVRLFAGLVVLKLLDFEERAADVLADRHVKSTSERLGQALIPRNQETLHLIAELLENYPGFGKTAGAAPCWSDLKTYLDREHMAKAGNIRRRPLLGPNPTGRRHERRSVRAKHSIALLVQSDGRKMYNFMVRRGETEHKKKRPQKKMFRKDTT